MSEANEQNHVAAIYQQESARVLAGLIRIIGDLELAEDALQEAFYQAMESWPQQGIPDNPYGWLISVGKFKAIDQLRRLKRGRELIAEKLLIDEEEADATKDWDKHLIEDDQLRLIFYCCHPAIPLDARITLALRETCGMSTAEIARAYLVSDETMKKRLSRAKHIIKQKQIPFEISGHAELNQRLSAVLHVIYLIYNEGYSASSGEHVLRQELSEQAIFLCRQLVGLLPASEVHGLLALMLIQESRRDARVDRYGDLIPLEEQDRALWHRPLIEEGIALINTAIMSGRLGPYTLQAAIASVHAQAESVESTRWDLILGYYDMLLAITPSPIIELNRAIVIGMRDGPEAGLRLLDGLMENKVLADYHLMYAARADLLKRQGCMAEAVDAYEQALARVQQAPEARYLKRQLEKIA